MATTRKISNNSIFNNVKLNNFTFDTFPQDIFLFISKFYFWITDANSYYCKLTSVTKCGFEKENDKKDSLKLKTK